MTEQKHPRFARYDAHQENVRGLNLNLIDIEVYRANQADIEAGKYDATPLAIRIQS